MNVEILSRYEGGTFSAQNSGYKLSGDYQRDGNTGALTTLNARCNAITGDTEVYVGEARGHQAGDQLNFNLNGIVSTHLAGVAAAVSELMNELTPAPAE